MSEGGLVWEWMAGVDHRSLIMAEDSGQVFVA